MERQTKETLSIAFKDLGPSPTSNAIIAANEPGNASKVNIRLDACATPDEARLIAIALVDAADFCKPGGTP